MEFSCRHYIGSDVGVTKMNLAYVENDKVVKQFKISTDALRSKGDIVADLIVEIENLINDNRLRRRNLQ